MATVSPGRATSESCTWGRAYLPLTRVLYLLIGGPMMAAPFAVAYAVLVHQALDLRLIVPGPGGDTLLVDAAGRLPAHERNTSDRPSTLQPDKVDRKFMPITLMSPNASETWTARSLRSMRPEIWSDINFAA